MGIRTDFLIKHIRPLGLECFNTLYDSPFREYLVNDLKITSEDAELIFKDWEDVALENPKTNESHFVQAAQSLAAGRWSEFYSTPASTVLFMEDTQLTSLSQAGAANANLSFPWYAPQPLTICVTIKEYGDAVVSYNVNGCNVTADENGDVFHFGGLL